MAHGAGNTLCAVTGSRLPRSRPHEQGVDPAGIVAFLDEVAASDLELHSLMVLRHGHVVAEGWWSPYRPDGVQLLYSLSKTVTATAAGLAIAGGLFSLDDPVLDHFPEIDRDGVDERYHRLLVRHLASMSTGHLEDTLERAAAAVTPAGTDRLPVDTPGLAHGFFRVPPDREPGTVFTYHNTATYLLGELVRRRTGEDLSGWLRPRLFDPLGIDLAPWDTDPSGKELGFTGLHLTTESVAKLGQLYLDQGRWNGRTLLDPSWVEQASRTQVDSARPGEGADWVRGYGFQLWMSRHGYRGDGAFGQLCLVLPDEDAVVAMTSATERVPEVLDAVWTFLLPALTAADGRQPARAGDEALTQRLDALALPPVATRVPVAGSAGFVPGDNAAFGSARTITVAAGDGGWQVELDIAGQRVVLPAGDGRWLPGTLPGRRGPDVRVYTSGGWTGLDRFALEVVAVESPHRVLIQGDRSTGRFGTRWNVAPLGAADPVDLGSGGDGGRL